MRRAVPVRFITKPEMHADQRRPPNVGKIRSRELANEMYYKIQAKEAVEAGIYEKY
jgi:hypothetical protein